MNKLKTLFKTETAQMIALIVVVCVGVWFAACESTVRSMVDPTQRINRNQLDAEVESFIAQANIRYSQLDKEDELRTLLAQHALIATETGVINPSGILAALFSILGVGAIVDNVNKRRVIRKNNRTYVESVKHED